MTRNNVTYADEGLNPVFCMAYAIFRAFAHDEAHAEYMDILRSLRAAEGDAIFAAEMAARVYLSGPSAPGRWLGSALMLSGARPAAEYPSGSLDAPSDRIEAFLGPRLTAWAATWLGAHDAGVVMLLRGDMLSRLWPDARKMMRPTGQTLASMSPTLRVLLSPSRPRFEREARRAAAVDLRAHGFKPRQRNKYAKWASIWFRVRILRESGGELARFLGTTEAEVSSGIAPFDNALGIDRSKRGRRPKVRTGESAPNSKVRPKT